MNSRHRYKSTAWFMAMILLIGGWLISSTNVGKSAALLEGPIQKGLLREYWLNVPGRLVSDLTAYGSFPHRPSGSAIIPNFQAPSNMADNYGVRIRGYVAPPRTGSYTFWIASDDHSELWLTTNKDDSLNPALAQKIAWVTGATDIEQWDKYPEQKSATVELEMGQIYYIASLHKEGAGNDYVSVAWSGPNLVRQVIHEQYLYAYSPNNTYNITYLSDLDPISAVNGWGPYERDRSNGENAPKDGNTITLNGVQYARGIGAHALSEIRYELNGQYDRFLADVGVDDEVGTQGSLVFQLYLDNTPLYNSGIMSGSSATQVVDVSVAGGRVLRLIVTDGGDNIDYDHADWANARLLKSVDIPPTSTHTPTGAPTHTPTPTSRPTSTYTPSPTNTAGPTATHTPTTPPGAQVIDLQVISSSDDAEESLDNGYVTLNNQNLQLGIRQNRAQAVGIRFRGLPIPQGAIIVDAYIEFVAAADANDAAMLQIYGHDTDNSLRYRQTTANISSRDRTTSMVNWQNVEPWVAQKKYRTPGIAPVVQEIVSRSGWASENHMSFIFLGNGTRIAGSYNLDWFSAPHLVITYLPPAEPSPTSTLTPAPTHTDTPQPPTALPSTETPTGVATPTIESTPVASTPTLPPAPTVNSTQTPTPPGTPEPTGNTALDAIQTYLLFHDLERDGVVSPGDTLLVQSTIVNIGPVPAIDVLLHETHDPAMSLVPGTVRIFEGAELREAQTERSTFPIPVGKIGAGQEYIVMFQMLLAADMAEDVISLEIQGRVEAQNAPTILTRNSTLDGENQPTVILLGQQSAINKHLFLPIVKR